MKITTFKYTKADGSTSKRTILVSAEPTKLVSGTDISGLSTEDQVLYSMEVQRIKDVYLEALKLVNDKYDLNHNYRQFKPEGMSDVVEDIL
jgi:hypothetical protein